MNKFLIFTVLFIASTVRIFSQSPAPTDDVQFWNETTLTIPLIKRKDDKGKEIEKFSMFFNGILRVGRNVSRPVDERIGFGFDYKLNKFISFTTAYLYVAAQPFRGRKEYENRLRFAVTLENKFKKFSIRDRNLIEYRIRNSRADSTRYRNKFQFNYPFLKAGKELFTPFAADEIYYDFHEKEFTRNEFSVGITKKFKPNFSADFFFMLRNNRGTILKYVNIFGINLKFKIG